MLIVEAIFLMLAKIALADDGIELKLDVLNMLKHWLIFE